MIINVKTKNGGYDIIIENGIFDAVGSVIAEAVGGARVFVVTDTNVMRLHGDRLFGELEKNGVDYGVGIFKAGEHIKSHENLMRLYSLLCENKISRSDYIIAFGGGVIGDFAGYAAATYLRGMPFIQLPTTLLSQVDSSVGGKVAINLAEGKNLVGCFYPPAKVIIDPQLLRTLPERVFNDGMAEVIKYGAIRDEMLFCRLCDNDAHDIADEIIAACVNIKKQIVEIDEFDTGERMLLNFGHTYGHIVECCYNYEKYTHGEGVAAGMLKITKATEAMGLTEKGTYSRLAAVCKKYDLPVDSIAINADDEKKIMLMDKKGDRFAINYVILKKIGSAEILRLPKDKLIGW